MVALRWLRMAVLSLPFFFPLYMFKATVFGIPVTLVEAFIYAAFLALTVHLAVGHVKRNKALKLLHGFRAIFSKKHLLNIDFLKIFLPIFLFILAGVLSLIVTPEQVTMMDGSTIFYGQKIALGILKGWILNPILMFLLFIYVVKNNKDVLTLLNFYTVSALFLSLWAFMQIATQTYITPDARASGPFENANYLALYLAPAVLYTVVRIKEALFPVIYLEKYTFWKIPLRKGKFPLEKPETFLFLMAFLALFVSILYTKSYAGMLAVLLSAFFYFGFEYAEYRRNKINVPLPWKMIITVFVSLSILTLAVYNIDSSKWQSMFKFEERNSSSVRIEVYTTALTLLEENWLLGIGMGQFPAQYQLESTRILGHEPFEWNMLHPHNLFIAVWLNMGLLGVVAFMWILYLCVESTWPHLRNFAYKKVKETPKLRVLGLSLLMIILVHGLFDTPFFKNDLALLFWVIAAVCLLPTKKKVKID